MFTLRPSVLCHLCSLVCVCQSFGEMYCFNLPFCSVLEIILAHPKGEGNASLIFIPCSTQTWCDRYMRTNSLVDIYLRGLVLPSSDFDIMLSQLFDVA